MGIWRFGGILFFGLQTLISEERRLSTTNPISVFTVRYCNVEYVNKKDGIRFVFSALLLFDINSA